MEKKCVAKNKKIKGIFAKIRKDAGYAPNMAG
jgi:hypothetical protein